MLGDVVIGSGGLTVRPARAQSSTRSPGEEGDLGFEVLGLHRVTADCFADNVGSGRVLEKIGMRREKHSRGSAWHCELGWVDEYEYAVLRGEWSSRTTL